jgi:aminocarboxymuconate-semialdehyde decarboxylase
MATLPIQDVGEAVEELERAILQLGYKGAYIGTDLAGRNLDDRALWPLYQKCVDLDVPIFVHPHPIGIDGTAVLDRYRKYDLSWILGYIFEETLGIACLIFGGVIDAFPELKIFVSHGGGATPYQLGRLEFASVHRPEAAANVKRSVREYLRQIYVDCDLHNLQSLRFLLDVMGTDRVMVGSNYPGWDREDCFAQVAQLHLPASQEADVMGNNAQRLLRIQAGNMLGASPARRA